jgi:hypothetical protein
VTIYCAFVLNAGVAAIVIVILLLIGGSVVLIFIILKRRRKRKQSLGVELNSHPQNQTPLNSGGNV